MVQYQKMTEREEHERIEAELARAEAARRDGFEGRARVCARRAAGIAIRAYARRRQVELPSPSAYDLLTALEHMPGVPAEAREAAQLLTERVDTEFNLPAGADLIAEARRLASALESDSGPGVQQHDSSTSSS